MERSPRSLDEIVERQVREWELRRKARQLETRPPEPVIALSRQFGARGAAIAREVARRIEYRCWERELLDQIAASTDAPRAMLASLDEHRKDAIRERVSVLGADAPPTATDYERKLLEVLHAIAEHGRAVVVGRGAEFVLDPATTLRVRVVCTMQARVRGLIERNRIDEDEARAQIAAVDADRRDFLREHYGRDADDPTAYDLVINTERLPVPDAADILLAAHTARFPT